MDFAAVNINDLVRFDYIACGRVRTVEGRIVRILKSGEIPGKVIDEEFFEYDMWNINWRPVKEISYLVLVDKIIHLPKLHLMRNAYQEKP